MTFTQSISICLQKYATFSGRASRSEFWWFFLFCTIWNVLSTIGANAIFGEDTPAAVITDLFISLVLFLPFYAVSARRLHDIGRSGWAMLWYLPVVVPVAIVESGYSVNELWGLTMLLTAPLWVWLASKSQPEENRYGAALS